MIFGIHHVAVGVDDLDRAIAFYTDALQLEVVDRAEFDNQPLVDAAIGLQQVKARMAMLRAPNAHVELWEYANPEPEDRRSRPCDLGYPHFALQVSDIEEEYIRMKAAGMTFVGDVVHFGSDASAIYGRDPFGNVIELYEIRTAGISGLVEIEND